ncbi:MAG: SDR family oxidoreductase [Pseudomonadota bacterium]
MNKDLFSVEQKVVVVTGAARGNGLAIANGFRRYAARVVAVDILECDVPKDDQGLYIPMDLTQPEADRVVLQKSLNQYGRVDVLVNNAGISMAGEDPYSDKIWNDTLEVNLNAAARLCRSVARQMVKQRSGGSIINITSLGAERGFPDNPAYQVSKSALKQLSRAMARDFGKHGVRINNVCPGYIKTEMTKKSYSDPQLSQHRIERMMLPRWGEPDDLSGPCLFLASEAAAYITGIDLPVDGGWLAKGL